MNKGFSVLVSAVIAVVIAGVLTLAVPSPVVASSEDPAQPYWSAEFFDSRWPTARPVYTARYTDINFDWGTGSPNVAVPVDNFSARWTRTANFEAGNYKFWMI
ncbi:MAG: hypothetical protein GTO41_10095, partial [Burkholderiales bacterium]|nr:hypothetical protein [Burkholderiales bacterium]